MFSIRVDDELSVRLFEEQDAETLFKLIDRNRQWLGPWFEFEADTHSVDDTLAFIRRTRKLFTETGRFWAAVLQHGRLVGSVGISALDTVNRSAELGFWLARDATGRGLMTRACGAMLEYVFTTLGVHRIAIQCAVNNLASHAVARRLGFTQDGTLRQAEFARGTFRDVAVFSLLAHEWSGNRAGGQPSGSDAKEDPEYAHIRMIVEGEGLGPWRRIDPSRRLGFRAQLTKEIGPGHPLWEVPLNPVGTRTDGNEVLCLIDDGSNRVAVVNLMWTEQSGTPRYPKTTVFRSFERFVMHVMQDEYFLPRGP